MTGGRVSTTGLGGLALGGGSGWIERRCGYTVDNLLSVELVLADGRIVTASESEHPDLFWASRGGGGNLGVATSFELRLHPIGPTVLGGILLYPAPMAAAVLRHFDSVMASAPDEVGGGVATVHGARRGVRARSRCAAGRWSAWSRATRDRSRRRGGAARRCASSARRRSTWSSRSRTRRSQQLFDGDFPHGMRNYWTGEFLTGLPDAAIDVLCAFHASKPSPHTEIMLLPGGGAVSRVPDGATALTEREAPHNIHVLSLWEDAADDEANIAWTREMSAALKPFATGRVYVNFIGDEGEERVVASFGREGYARLQALKDRYDPDNLFRTSQNVPPSRS